MKKVLSWAKEKINAPSNHENPKLKKTPATFTEKPATNTFHTESEEPERASN